MIFSNPKNVYDIDFPIEFCQSMIGAPLSGYEVLFLKHKALFILDIFIVVQNMRRSKEGLKKADKNEKGFEGAIQCKKKLKKLKEIGKLSKASY